MIRRISIAVLGTAALACAASAGAQSTGSDVRFPAGYAPGESPCTKQTDGTCRPVSASDPLPVATNGRQEGFTLVAVNAPGPAVSVYGGNYLADVLCATPGTVTIRRRGADGATMVPVYSVTANGSFVLAFSGNTLVDATLSGSAGCYVTLSRIP